MDPNRTVVVWAEDPIHGDLAAAIVEETAALLGPQGWTVDLGRAEDLAALGIVVASGAWNDAGARPTIWVDPEGRQAAVPSGAVPSGAVPSGAVPSGAVQRVILEPLGEAVRRDLRAFADLLDRLDFEASGMLVATAGGTDSDLAAAVDSIDAGWPISVAEHVPSPDRGVAVYFPPGSRVSAEEVETLTAAGVPTFGAGGILPVEGAVLLTRDRHGEGRLARLAALAALAQLRGLESHTASPVDAGGPARLVLNLDTARQLDLEVPLGLRLDVKTVGEEFPNSAPITPAEARREAIDANLAVLARRADTSAAAQAVDLAASALGPRLALTGGGRIIDGPSAEAAFGSRPERQVNVGATASWPLVAEGARTALEAETQLQGSRQERLRAFELDIGLEASTGLLALAQARTLERIAEDQLALTLAELDSARARRSVGLGGRADVARLEARASEARRSRVAAYGDRRALEIQFNRLLGRPLDRASVPSFGGTAEGTGPPLPSTAPRPAVLRALGEELLAEALDREPGVQAAQRELAAAERRLLGARRAFYVPAITAVGRLDTEVAEGGDGVNPPSFGDGPGVFPEVPDTAWSLGIDLSLPLFTGGERSARRTQDALAVDAARLRLSDAERAVEERLRLALVALEASLEAALQAALAVHAAEEAFEVVSDGYRQGRETLTTWLAAQSEQLQAQQRKVLADHDAHIRMLEAQRAVGVFDDALLSSLFPQEPQS